MYPTNGRNMPQGCSDFVLHLTHAQKACNCALCITCRASSVVAYSHVGFNQYGVPWVELFI